MLKPEKPEKNTLCARHNREPTLYLYSAHTVLFSTGVYQNIALTLRYEPTCTPHFRGVKLSDFTRLCLPCSLLWKFSQPFHCHSGWWSLWGGSNFYVTSVDKTLWCDYANEISLEVRSCGVICFKKIYKRKFGIFVKFAFGHIWQWKG